MARPIFKSTDATGLLRYAESILLKMRQNADLFTDPVPDWPALKAYWRTTGMLSPKPVSATSARWLSRGRPAKRYRKLSTGFHSMQMRAALAGESAKLFGLDNVEVKERHILIHGTLADYSIHLHSGMVSKGGRQLAIIPVHSQHRGRIFLPFVDDDPKSAEIISKMRYLAKDNKINQQISLKNLNRLVNLAGLLFLRGPCLSCKSLL